MKINRNNYEIFFIDYLDNNLSQADLLDLTAFLAENPDLESELNEIKNVKLKPETINFSSKSDLKKHVTYSGNFNELCIKYIENKITFDDKNKLFEIIKQNPDLKNEFELFKLTILKPDNSIIFSDKKSLKKYILSPFYKNAVKLSTVAAAAIIFILIVLQINNNNIKINNTKVFANNKNIKKINSTKSNIIKNNNINNKFIATSKIIRNNIITNNNIFENKDTIAETIISNNKNVPDSTVLNNNLNNIAIEPVNNNLANNESDNYQIKNNKYLDSTLNAVFENSKYSHFRDMINNVPYNSITASNSKFPNIGVWDVIKAGTSGINYITGSQIEVENKTDKKKHIKHFSLKIGKIGFTRTVHK